MRHPARFVRDVIPLYWIWIRRSKSGAPVEDAVPDGQIRELFRLSVVQVAGEDRQGDARRGLLGNAPCS